MPNKTLHTPAPRTFARDRKSIGTLSIFYIEYFLIWWARFLVEKEAGFEFFIFPKITLWALIFRNTIPGNFISEIAFEDFSNWNRRLFKEIFLDFLIIGFVTNWSQFSRPWNGGISFLSIVIFYELNSLEWPNLSKINITKSELSIHRAAWNFFMKYDVL